MASRTYGSNKGGEIDLDDGSLFRWTLEGNRSPEIYGWIEKDHSIVPKTGGWWRTDDPEEACKRACLAFDRKIKADD